MVTVADQVNQEIEDLGLNGHKGSAPAKLAEIRIERTILEQIAQEPILLAARRRTVA